MALLYLFLNYDMIFYIDLYDPNLKIINKKPLREFTFEDLELNNYHSHNSIKAQLK